MGEYNDVIDRTTNQLATTSGPVELPPDIGTEVIQMAVQQSASLSLFRRVEMSRRQEFVPALASLPQAYWVGGDTGLDQTTVETWKNKTLIAAPLATIVPIPKAVIEDQAFGLYDEIVPRLAEAAGKLIDSATLFGVNWPALWGAASFVESMAVAAGNVLTSGSLPADPYGNTPDLSVDIGGDGGIMSLVEADGFDVNGFAAAVRVKAKLRGLRDKNGQPVFVRGLQTAPDSAVKDPDSIEGERVAYIANGAFDPTRALLICGDWSKGIIGVRRDMTLEKSDEASITDDTGKVILNLWQQDSMAVKLTMRVAFVVANPVTALNATENTRLPFAVLRPAGYSGS